MRARHIPPSNPLPARCRMTIASNLGFPRIGRRRELKHALERHWAGELTEAALLAEAAKLRAEHWRLQSGLGIGHIPCGDFALYDAVLDTACMLGAIPAGYGWSDGAVSLATRFALARGSRGTPSECDAGIPPGLHALEMTKWFDTNYHYLVPKLIAGQDFALTGNRLLDAYLEARALGIETRPVLLGPVSFLLLSKTTDGSDPLDLLGGLIPIYAQILLELAQAGCAWVQIDEPVLATDLSPKALRAFTDGYAKFAAGITPKLLLTSYFGRMAENLPAALRLPVAGWHLDLIRGSADLPYALQDAPREAWLSLGIVDGRNVWRADLAQALATLRPIADARGTGRLMIAPSCSLLHVPVDLTQEAGPRSSLDLDLRAWLAFAVQKLEEVATLTRGLDAGAGLDAGGGLDAGDGAIAGALARSSAAARCRAASTAVHNPAVAARLAASAGTTATRASPFPERRAAQRAAWPLPDFPTTTIGSFPQTRAVREARSAVARGSMSQAEYDHAIAQWIEHAIRTQEDIGLDVLVHGEAERNDMVKYFGEQLRGFAFTTHGWVQSYGSRCVAPPIIWGDVSRPAPMTVKWASHAQSLTGKPVKGMLTGPVTMLQWSFVRDDVPRETVCRQIALALRDEVADLEAAGIAFVQVDEPAFREGLPLRAADRADYLRWAVGCFRLCTAGVRDETAIHTHMCYAEFNDIMPAIADMDADVISIETTRSRMELLDAFRTVAYPNEIGPGIWDIHSPRVPDLAEMVGLLERARTRLADWQIWVNPDCGLKTRQWDEVIPALENLVSAARAMRS
jgi:5-methyltetrahydropteroyltriglutamate--homocysteine methyltransferase